MSYYLRFTNGSRRLIDESISVLSRQPQSIIHSNTISLPFPGFCVSSFVKITAGGGVLKRSPFYYSCRRIGDSLHLDFSTVFRNLKGQIYVLFDGLTYVPVCLTTPATSLQHCPLLLEEASVIDTPQEKFTSRDFLRISPLEFVPNTVLTSNRYCSKFASHCDSSRDVTKRLCWKESATFLYRQNNLTLFEGNTTTFLCRLYCSKCKVTVSFVWKRGETELLRRTGIKLNIVRNFKYHLYNAKKTDSGLYTFSIVVGDTVYSNSFFVTVLGDSSPTALSDFLKSPSYTSSVDSSSPGPSSFETRPSETATLSAFTRPIVPSLFVTYFTRSGSPTSYSSNAAENSIWASEIGPRSVSSQVSSTWIIAGGTITAAIMIAVTIVIVRKYQPRFCHKSCGLTTPKTNLPVECDELQCEAEELWTPSPFAIRYASHSCGTFELFVDSTMLSFKLEESASNEISKSKGGRIHLANYDISIEFPRDSLQEEHVTITASLFISSEPVKGRFLSLLELLPHGIKFDLPVVIRSSYHVAGSRSVDSKLHMFYSEKFRSETFFNYVGELSESSVKASYLKMDYFFGEKFLEIQALSFCNLCSWSEGPCKVAFSVFRNRGSDSKFGVTIALSCAHPEILRNLKNYHVQENSKGFLTTSFITWNKSWSKMEIALQSDDEWKASATATFTVEDKNTVMKCPRESFLGPTSNFLLTKVASNVNADVTSIQFNINAYETDLTAPVTMTQIIVDINPLSDTKIVTWTGDSDTSSLYSSPSSGNGSSGSRERFSCRSGEGRNIDSLVGLNASGEHRTDSDGYESMPVDSAGKNKVTQEQCNKLATMISPIWKDVARKLSFPTQEIKGIKDEHLGNLDHQSIEMLDRWLIRNGAEATVFTLCKALFFSNARGHAESVFGDKFVASVVDVLDCGSAV
ncbi:uncharacterized protein [Oscarella lobularis]